MNPPTSLPLMSFPTAAVVTPLVGSERPRPITEGCLVEFSRDLMGGLFRLHREHGPIAALRDSEAGQMIVCLFAPEYNQQVLSRADRFHARFFGIRGPKRSSQRRVTCGLLAMNGDQHKRNRRMVKEPFGPRAIAAYRPTIEALAREESALWREGVEFDYNQAMIRYNLRVTSRLLFGLDEPTLAYELGEQIAEWVSLNHEIGIGALVSTPEFHAGYEGLLDFAKGLETNVMRLIRRRKDNPDPDANDVLSILVQSHDGDGGLSDEELVGQCCVLFAAAHMTTAHSFSWTTFLLAQHPEVMQALWEQINAGTVEEPGEAGGLPLLERVIKEAMRVLPASAYSVRMNVEREQLGPLDLPPGTPIVFTPLITHRLESSFPDPTRFDPDRWLSINPSPYAYHPFGGGPRRCIGGPLAMEVLRTSLPIFLRDWRLTVPSGAEVSAEVKSTMLNPKHGVPMIAERHAATPTADGGFRASVVTGNVTELVDLQAAASPRKPR